MNLYKNNPCTLPCWWGINPGQTDWRDAWQFLGRFATNSYPWETQLIESKDLPGYMYFRVYLNVPQTFEEKNYYFSLNYLIFVININSFKVDYIDVNTGNIEAYTIPKILAEYGKPEQVYAVGGASQVSELTGVSLLLYYPQYGFISNHFTTVDLSQIGNPTITACFQKVTNLYLWPKNQELSFVDRLKISAVDPVTMSLMKPLDQVSNLNVSSFYQTFVNKTTQPCIQFNNELGK
jgi:hypothetical protein